MENDRNHEGRFTQQHTDDDVLAAVRAHEPAATSEVGNELGIARQSADYRLRKLRDEGRVNSKKIGASLVWFAAESQEGHSTPVNEPEPIADESPERTQETQEATKETQETGLENLDEILENWPPRAESKREQRKQAGLAALEYLRDVGEAKAMDFKENVEPKAPVDGQSTSTWWKKAAHPAVKRAQEVGVVEYHNGTKVYSWAGER